jgi:hypothetical protein
MPKKTHPSWTPAARAKRAATIAARRAPATPNLPAKRMEFPIAAIPERPVAGTVRKLKQLRKREPDNVERLAKEVKLLRELVAFYVLEAR